MPDMTPASAATPDEVVTSICGICDAGCGVDVHLRDGRIERIVPLPYHPHGTCCPRGLHAPEIVYSPDRLLTPLKRRGPKGTAEFEPIAWDDAYDLIADGLQRAASRHGPESICMYTGRGAFEQSLCDVFAPAGTRESSASSLFFPLGSPNTTGVGALCYVSYGLIAPNTTCGSYALDMFDDIDRSDLIVVWGANPATDSPPLRLKRIKRAQARGARVIVIDHRRSETARATRAQWIGIRPGTDGALALGMLHVLINEALFDHEFVENWTVGFEALRDYVGQFTPETVEAITWVPAEVVRQIARAVASASGASLVMYTGLEYTNSGTQSIRAALTLWALAGQLDVPGGKCFRMPGADFHVHTEHLAPPANPEPVGKDKYPVYYHYRYEAHAMELPEAILNGQPYPVRAMLIGGSSLTTAYPNPALWRKALGTLDFLAVVDRFLTGDALYADVVLPATTGFEIESYRTHGGYIQWRQRVIPPRGQARNDYLIYSGLAERLGYGHLYPQSEAALLEFALQGTGLSLGELKASPAGVQQPEPQWAPRKWERGLLRRDGQPGFETPSGKFEIESSVLRHYGYEPLPKYTEPQEGPLAAPEVAEKFPLVFNSGARIQSDFRSQHHNIAGLVKMQPDPLALVHTRDAVARGIADGDDVLVRTPRGRVQVKARVTDDIVPGVVEVNMGGGGPSATPSWRRANVNELTDMNNRDPISGFPVYKALLCEVAKLADSERGE
jgi:anaerobic selenocysteine-containing dehydrogenase